MREESLSRMSALLDGECPDAELDQLLDEIEREPELAVHWSRLCRDQELRLGRAPLSTTCICANVMARLDEPETYGARVRPLWKRRPSLQLPRWAAPMGGLAAAASMGAAAVLLVQPASTPQPVSSSASLAAIGEPVSWATPGSGAQAIAGPADDAVRAVAASSDEPQGQMLHEYLIDHSNAVATEGMGGTMRYARFAAHEAEYRPMTLEYP